MGRKVNQSGVLEVKQCSPWCYHPIVGLWGDSMHDNSCVYYV